MDARDPSATISRFLKGESMQKGRFNGGRKGPPTTTTVESLAAKFPTTQSPIQSRGEVLPSPSAQSRPYPMPPNWRKTEQQLRCQHCGNWRIESFDSVYARQSSLSKFKRGLIIKTGWSQTHRQSYLAMRCAPPKKKHIWWGIGLAIVALAALRYLPPDILDSPVPSTLIDFIVLAFGILGSGYGLYWNRTVYPEKRDTWESSFYCSRCAKVTVICL